MKALIKHLLATNAEQITARSRLHCHARNVHSVMLLESPGKTIRLFVAEPGNDLYLNKPDMFARGMSVGFHAHHCELTLVMVKGCMLNWQVVETDADAPAAFAVDKFDYHSALNGGEGKAGFTRDRMTFLRTDEARIISEGETHYMPATAIHTVAIGPYAARHSINAWLVFEGRENPAHKPVTFSTSNLEIEDLAGLYQPTTGEDIIRLIKAAGLQS